MNGFIIILSSAEDELNRVSRPVCWCKWAPSDSGPPAGPMCGTFVDLCSKERLRRARGNACFYRGLSETQSNRPSRNKVSVIPCIMTMSKEEFIPHIFLNIPPKYF